MPAWRIRIAWIVLVTGLTPAILAYATAMIRARTAAVDAVTASHSPNPTTSAGASGPIETLVHLDPSWAGTAMIWTAAATTIIIAIAIATAVFLPRELTGRRLLGLRLVSFAAGLPLAWPWLSALLFA